MILEDQKIELHNDDCLKKILMYIKHIRDCKLCVIYDIKCIYLSYNV